VSSIAFDALFFLSGWQYMHVTHTEEEILSGCKIFLGRLHSTVRADGYLDNKIKR
jgi:hypothetical protein